MNNVPRTEALFSNLTQRVLDHCTFAKYIYACVGAARYNLQCSQLHARKHKLVTPTFYSRDYILKSEASSHEGKPTLTMSYIVSVY